MGFLDKVVDTISNTSSDISQKTRETSERSRLKLENRKIEKEIEETIYKIGLYMVNNEFEYVNKIMAEECKSLTALQNKLSKNLEAINELNNARTCAHCGKKIVPGSEFCVYCGAKITEPVEETEQVEDADSDETRICEKCGNPIIEEGALFCSVCGKKVE